MNALGIILFISSLFVIVCILVWLVSWSVHKDMTRGDSERQCHGNFKDFLREFNAYDGWEQKSTFPGSIFARTREYSEYKIHASIIKFNGVGMLLNPIAWLQFCIWIKFKTKRNTSIVPVTAIRSERENKITRL